MRNEFGRSYHPNASKKNGAQVLNQDKGPKAVVNSRYKEVQHLALFLCGRKAPESWNTGNEPVDLFTLKAAVKTVLSRLGIKNIRVKELSNEIFSQGLLYELSDKPIVSLGKVKKAVLKIVDVKQDVYYADFNWDNVLQLLKTDTIRYSEVPRFPEVRRDLALLLDRTVKYEQLEQLAYQTEKNLLKEVNLFDIYEGDKLEPGKKSYALSFILQDENNTLTDKQVDQVMDKLIKVYQQKLGAAVR